MFERTLIVLAHPDDEVLGCGGTIARLLSEGRHVSVLLLNNGCNTRPEFDESAVASSMLRAMKCLMSRYDNSLTFKALAFKVEDFYTLTDRDFTKEILKFCEFTNVGYDTVITHNDTDLHHAHRVVNKAVLTAFRYGKHRSVRNILTCPVISSTDISPDSQFTPNLYMDISHYIDRKVAAMSCYEMEAGVMPEHRGRRAIEAHGAYHGLHANCFYAEPFKVLRSVW